MTLREATALAPLVDQPERESNVSKTHSQSPSPRPDEEGVPAAM